MVKIYDLPCGDEVHRFDYNIVIPFKGKRRVLCTAPYNGGYRTDLKTVFNHDCNPGVGCSAEMKGKTYREHMMRTMEEIGLDPETAAGLETAASMDNAAICTERFEKLAVTAIVTGGIEVNAGRVGDPATWIEDSAVAPEYRPGTINILLCINGDLSQGAMARALVTCTEAKTAAIQELMAESRSSRGLATGSGTDGTIVAADMESEMYLTDAGKHSKLGELIGRAVKPAVKRALYLQTKLDAGRQHNVIRRLSRFGVSEAGLYRRYVREQGALAVDRARFSELLEEQAVKGGLVAKASFIAHAIDQMDWGLLSVGETTEAASEILMQMGMEEPLPDSGAGTPDETVELIVEAFEKVFLKKVLKVPMNP